MSLSSIEGRESSLDLPASGQSEGCPGLDEDDLQLNILPNLMAHDFPSVVSTCRSWRSRVASFAIDSGGARKWLCGSYASDLEGDAVHLCRRASSSSWFATTGYTLALLVATTPGQDLLQHVLDIYDYMPVWVARPDRDLRTKPVFVETSRNQRLSGVTGKVFDQESQYRITHELSQHWGSAYVSTDGEFDYAVRDQYEDVMRRLRALWALAGCCKGTPDAIIVEEQLVMFRNSSLRANERWTVYILAMCSDEEIANSHKLALALMSYHEGRLMG